MKNSKGFTLVELLLVMVIVAILTTIAVVAYQKYTTSARVSEAIQYITTIALSQKVEKQSVQGYYFASSVGEFKAKGIGIIDSNFDYSTAPTTDGFQIIATCRLPGLRGDTIEFRKVEDQPVIWSVGGSNKEIDADMLPKENH